LHHDSNMKNLFRLFVRLADFIEVLSEWSGRVTSWLVLGMTLLISYDVTMRYAFHSGSVALQELEWHLFAIVFLIGAAYTLKHDEHVRVDVLYQGRWMNDRRRACVNLLGGLLFLLPFCLLIIISSIPFVHNAYQIGETSPDPGGLGHRYLIKAAIPLGFLLLMLQGVASMIRNARVIFCPRRQGGGDSIKQEQA
jgi:TRAP-type mannitol/chloroaromatic compound transport system permease small subunit